MTTRLLEARTSTARFGDLRPDRFRLLSMANTLDHEVAKGDPIESNLTIGRGSMHHLYKYKPNHNVYRRKRVYESRDDLLIPPLDGRTIRLTSEMVGKIVPIRRNKSFRHKLPRNDSFAKHLNWASDDNPEGIRLVNPSVNQQACGSCWAFAAVGSLETSVARSGSSSSNRTLDLPLLSVQELLNCFSPDHCTTGGNPLTAFDYLHRFGLSSAAKLPYTGTPVACSTNLKPIARASAWGFLSPNHNSHLALVLRYIGPVAVAMNGAHPSFVNYRSGIFAALDCAATPNHAVLITGYGETANGTHYWIARNSWGREWGEDGFVRILREQHGPGVCGILQSPSVALGGYRPGDKQQPQALSLSIVTWSVLVILLLLVIPLSHVCRSPWNVRSHRRRKRRRLLLRGTDTSVQQGEATYGSIS